MNRTAAWLLAACFSLPAQAQDGVPKRVVCYDDLFEPFFMQQGGKYFGLSADTILEAGRRAGIQVELRKMPWRRLESELAKRKIACAFALSHTPERDEYLDFGKVPLNPTDYVVFVREESAVRTLDDLKGKTIGIRAGVRIAEGIAQGNKEGRWNLSAVGTDAANFQKLALGRVDAVVTDLTGGLYTLKQIGMLGVRRLQPPLMHYDTYMVFPKGEHSAALAAAFDHALDKMRQDGTTERIMERYLGAPTR